jgi:hypothetical protein
LRDGTRPEIAALQKLLQKSTSIPCSIQTLLGRNSIAECPLAFDERKREIL